MSRSQSDRAPPPPSSSSGSTRPLLPTYSGDSTARSPIVKTTSLWVEEDDLPMQLLSSGPCHRPAVLIKDIKNISLKGKKVPPAGHVKKHPEPVLNRLFARNHHGKKPLSPPNEKNRILVEKSYLSSSKGSGFDGEVATGGVDPVGIIGDQGGRRGTDRSPGDEPGEGGGEEHEDEAQRAHRLLCSPTPTHREGQHEGTVAILHR
ncbi:hypothetical protein BHM03_00022502, partial [Ensete ventricosum]